MSEILNIHSQIIKVDMYLKILFQVDKRCIVLINNKANQSKKKKLQTPPPETRINNKNIVPEIWYYKYKPK